MISTLPQRFRLRQQVARGFAAIAPLLTASFRASRIRLKLAAVRC